ncbi:hypothetical protein [Streptomyces sp. NPDC051162]|uniref:hypothetical protein n=1 Tax=Streptomyces sp. NPDC051162 TaxID=3154747 RepID=UPI003423DE9C
MRQKTPDSSALDEVRPSTPAKKHRRVLLGTAIVLAALLVATGGYLYFGGYDRLQDDRSLDRACHSILPRSELKTLMKSNELRATDERMFEHDSGWFDGCSVEARDNRRATAQFSIGWGGQAGMLLSALSRNRFGDYEGVAVPIGGGWKGTMTRSGSTINATVTMECQVGSPHKNLLVSVRSYRGTKDDAPSDQGKRFGAMAELATQAAQKAAIAWSCKAQTGTPTHSASPSEVSWPSPVSLQQSIGSCRPLASLAPALTRHGIQKAVETPSGDSLIEDCYLLDSKDRPVYRISAYYGLYARDLLSTEGWPPSSSAGKDPKSGDAWASSDCSNSLGTARFTSGVVSGTQGEVPTSADPNLSAELLTSFVKDAAQRHGCTNLSLP